MKKTPGSLDPGVLCEQAAGPAQLTAAMALAR